MARPPGRTPEEQFQAQIDDLKSQIAELRSRPLYLPVLEAVPDASYAGNFWAYPDGRLVFRLKDGTLRQLSSASASVPAGSNPPPPPQPTTRIGTYTATWSQAYRESGAFTGGDSNNLYYGSSGEGSYNGRQKSLIGFDYATIASDLAGSTISSVKLYLFNTHTWFYSGATCYAGIHNNTAKPGTYGGSVHDFVSSFHTNNGGANAGEWHTVSNEFGSRLRDGSGKGVILQAPSSSTTYYGYAAAVGSGLPAPKLQITYIK